MAQIPPTGSELISEEPDDPSPAEAERWIGIYADLIEFTEVILQRTREKIATVSAPAARHLESTNVRILVEELDVFRDRLAALQRTRT